jgi:two-component system sensor histidine kinase KdpD
MQTVEAEIKKMAAVTSQRWIPSPTSSGVANADNTTRALGYTNELRGALLDSIAHDLRSPLTVIRALSEILRTESAMARREQEEMLAVVEKECCRLDRMIGQTIRKAQLVPGVVQVNPQPQKLRKLINFVLRQTRPWLRQHTVRLRISDALPTVPMDCELVGRVLRHLLENAVGYSPPGSSIEILAQIEGDRLVVTVADEGPGIHEADKPFIFEKSFRGRNQRVHTQGTGMGLAITRAILEAHGGGINVVNSPGHGTAFTFWIPALAVAGARSDGAVGLVRRT